MHRSRVSVVGGIFAAFFVLSVVSVIFLGDGGIDPRAIMWVLWPGALVILAWSWIAMHRHGKAVKHFAGQHGWAYVERDDSLIRHFRESPFGRGHSHACRHVIRGHFAGYGCVSFTYSFVTGSGKNKQTHLYTIDAIELPAWLPHLEVTPEGGWERVAKAFGGQDIEVESATFNQRWRLTSRNARYAHAMMHPRMIERFEQPGADRLAVSVDGTSIVGWFQGTRGPEDLSTRLGLLTGVARRIPDHVWREYGAAPRRHG